MEFTKTTLGELSIGKGQYGIGASAVDYSKDLYTYLRITDINDDGTLNMSDLKSVDDEKAGQYILQPNDMVFARTGNSTGRNYFYDGSDGTFVYAGFLIKFSIDPQKVNPKYVKYYCLSDEYKGWVQGHSTGSTRGNINAQTYAGMEILLPPREQQDKLVCILDDLELKRKTNAAINRNLQEQAQAYFDELFDTNEGLDGTLSDVGTIVAGGTPSKARPEYYKENGIAWITPKDLSVDRSVFIYHGENDISDLGYSKSSATKMPEGTVLFSSRAPIGYIAIAGNEVTTNQGFKSVVPNEDVGTAYIYFLLKKLLPVIESMASGSTFKEISGSAMKMVPISIPDKDSLKDFNAFCMPLFEEIKRLELEAKRLSSLRDALLPKLMSGELDVSDIDI